jgi:hypothetical protein
VLATAEEMLSPTTPLYPNDGWGNCNFCRFREPCFAMDRGHDVAFLLENEYRKRSPYHPLSLEVNGVTDE